MKIENSPPQAVVPYISYTLDNATDQGYSDCQLYLRVISNPIIKRNGQIGYEETIQDINVRNISLNPETKVSYVEDIALWLSQIRERLYLKGTSVLMNVEFKLHIKYGDAFKKEPVICWNATVSGYLEHPKFVECIFGKNILIAIN